MSAPAVVSGDVPGAKSSGSCWRCFSSTACSASATGGRRRAYCRITVWRLNLSGCGSLLLALVAWRGALSPRALKLFTLRLPAAGARALWRCHRAQPVRATDQFVLGWRADSPIFVGFRPGMGVVEKPRAGAADRLLFLESVHSVAAGDCRQRPRCGALCLAHALGLGGNGLGGRCSPSPIWPVCARPGRWFPNRSFRPTGGRHS